MKTVVYYGSTTGTCEDIANRIASALDGADVKNASELGAYAAADDFILLGTSTWGDGEVQDDRYGVLDTLKGLALDETNEPDKTDERIAAWIATF